MLYKYIDILRTYSCLYNRIFLFHQKKTISWNKNIFKIST